MFPFIRTLRSLSRVGILSLMAACALLALIVVVGIVTAITWAADHWVVIHSGWLDTLVTWGVGLVTGIGGWFMLPALTVLIGGVFQETVIQRVERHDYPHFPRSDGARFWPDLLYDLGFTAKALSLNLLVLPLYLLGVGLPISIVLNTYLLGHECFEAVAGHHYGKSRARELARQHRRPVYAGGLIITLAGLVPVLNLFVPILAVVWMVHVFHLSGAAGRSRPL